MQQRCTGISFPEWSVCSKPPEVEVLINYGRMDVGGRPHQHVFVHDGNPESVLSLMQLFREYAYDPDLPFNHEDALMLSSALLKMQREAWAQSRKEEIAITLKGSPSVFLYKLHLHLQWCRNYLTYLLHK
jgi:hypothetical protein